MSLPRMTTKQMQEAARKLDHLGMDTLWDNNKRLQAANGVLLAALLGVRGMAEIEAATGSRTWRKAIEEIDRCIAEARLTAPLHD